MRYVFLILAGLIGGIFGGMGMGGGTLLIPILTVLLGIKQHTAQAINLVGFIPMSAVCLIIHISKGYVDKKGVLLLIIPALVTGLLGSFLATKVSGALLKRIFGIFLTLLSFYVLYEAVKDVCKKHKNGNKTKAKQNKKQLKKSKTVKK